MVAFVTSIISSQIPTYMLVSFFFLPHTACFGFGQSLAICRCLIVALPVLMKKERKLPVFEVVARQEDALPIVE